MKEKGKLQKVTEQLNFTIYGVAKKLGLSYSHAHKLVTAPELPPETRLNTLLRFSEELGMVFTIEDGKVTITTK